MRKKWIVIIGTLLAGGCCTSRPDVAVDSGAARSIPVMTSSSETPVVETRYDWHDATRNRAVPVKIYAAAGADRAPVVIVSRGIGEDRDSYEYLGLALAARGFMAVHITHAGTDRATLERGYLHLYRATKDKKNWVNRPLDVSFVLDQLKDDPRVRVIVPMSMPRMDGVVPPGGYDAIEVPALNITGTCDSSLIYRTLPRHRRVPFESGRAAAQYLVTLRGVTHNSFSNREDVRHPAIAALAVEFLRAHLMGDAAAAAFFDTPRKTTFVATEMTIERNDAGVRAVR
ncbi:MAG: hypothetical protein JJE51_07455 [Thermoanaerobaculia bacterium]|nr:hypothetical protein [Thermoanaerobaculia bacterium]